MLDEYFYSDANQDEAPDDFDFVRKKVSEPVAGKNAQQRQQKRHGSNHYYRRCDRNLQKHKTQTHSQSVNTRRNRQRQ